MRYFEDIADDFEALVGVFELTEDAVIAFAKQWDPQPFHTDPEAAKRSVFGGLVASSAQLFAICTRLFCDFEDPFRVVAMLGKDKLRLPSPARAGATLSYRTRCIGKRESGSRRDAGIVTLADTVTDQDGQVVLSQQVTLLVARRA